MSEHHRPRRMLKSQRILVFVSLLMFAWMLHVTYCDWHWRYDRGHLVRPFPGIVAFRVDRIAGSGGSAEPIYAGLFRGKEIGQQTAVCMGVIMPLALVCFDAYLLLGWRYDSRVRRGVCPACGYNLRGKLKDGCPECGWGRETAR